MKVPGNDGAVCFGARPTSYGAFFALLLSLGLLTGCDGTSPVRARDGGTGEAGGADGTDGGTAAVWTYGSTVSNVSATTFTVTKSATAANLELLSSNFVSRSFGDGGASVEWFGEVRNNGTTPVCSARVRIDFLTAERFGVATLSGFVYGDPYQSQSRDVVLPCVAPGKTGVVWTIDSLALAPEISSIDIVEAKLDSHPEDASPAPSAPVLSGTAIVQDASLGPTFWTITGNLTATQTIYNIEINGYFKAANGLVVLRAIDVNLDTVNAGASWKWEAVGFDYKGPKPASFLLAVNYLRGAKQ